MAPVKKIWQAPAENRQWTTISTGGLPKYAASTNGPICTGGSHCQPQCKCPFVLAVVITNRQYKWWRWILPTASRSIFPLAVGNEDRQCSPCYKYASSSSRQFIVPRSSHESTILGGHFFQETRGEVLILISLEEEALEG